nr:alkaline phosphatase D family protein [Allomuricauda sp.]
MRRVRALLLLFICVTSCTSSRKTPTKADVPNTVVSTDFTVAFGSCNKQSKDNPFWDDILDHQPMVWIWGGDNIYADTDDMELLKTMYDAQLQNVGYAKLRATVPIVGTWDDHDYGLNDGGEEFHKKKESQQVFLDFMEVPQNSDRRTREGVYSAHSYETPNGKVKVLVLDTRYFRSPLEKDPDPMRRYKKNWEKTATILGTQQWDWLESELKTSDADFNLIVSSIQFLSGEHGFESWGNFPREVEKLKRLVIESRTKGVMVLSGDRHISEFSKVQWEEMSYPLIDFTSSGLTHSYADFEDEPNPHRQGLVVSQPSFGLLEIDFGTRQVRFKMMGENGMVFQELKQQY